MKVLVTGSTGFIGANLVRELVGDEVETHLIIRPNTKNLWRIRKVRKQARLHEIDLLDAQGVMELVSALKPNVFFHLATYGSYPSQKDIKRILEVNLLGTVNLLEAAEKGGFEKFVSTGSSSEYGKKSEVMSEEVFLEPSTAYGVSKAAATMYCMHKARAKQLPITVFRPFSVYGPWEEPSRLFPTIIQRALSGENLELVAPDVARDYVYVDDIVDVLLSSLKNDNVNGQVINLCSGRQTTLKEVVETLLTVTGSESKPLWGAHGGRSYDTSVWVGDNTKAKKLLGWEASTGLAEGISRMAEWSRKHSEHYL